MKRRTKVVHLTEDMGVGGQEKVIATLAENLDRRRFEAEVWCVARGGALAEALRESGIRIRILGLPSYHNPLNVLHLAMQLRLAGVDIVHTHGSFAGTFGRLSAILAGRRAVVVHVHTTEHGLRRRHIRIQKLLNHFTRAIVCVSQSVRDFLIAGIGIPSHKIRVIYNGVPRQKAEERKQTARELEGGDCLAVSIGSLVENKGHRVLIDAFQRAISLRPNLKLLIAGDGPLRGQLERQVTVLRLETQIGFTGRLADVHAVLGQADMFILPTLYREGLSIALLEASQHGIPSIGSRVGGVPEVVEHNRTGLLVPPGDVEALAGAMLTLAADPCLRTRLGAAARREYEQRFCAERMVAEIEALYASLFTGERCAA